jgi:hypothetical protein
MSLDLDGIPVGFYRAVCDTCGQLVETDAAFCAQWWRQHRRDHIELDERNHLLLTGFHMIRLAAQNLAATLYMRWLT